MKRSHRFSTTWLLMAALAVALLMLVGCAEEPAPAPETAQEEEATKPPPEPAAEEPPAETAEAPPAEEAKPPAEEPKPAAAKKSLMNPSALNEKAPDVFMVNLATSKGLIKVQVTRSWAPVGADRFYNLVKNGFYDEARFFRVVPNFVVQFGMHADPAVSKVWEGQRIKDDPVTRTNRKGSLTYAAAGVPNTRTTQVFINLKANAFLDSQGFAPFGRVVEGMDLVEALHSGYGEQPEQPMIRAQGNSYLNKTFPNLDYIQSATIEE